MILLQEQNKEMRLVSLEEFQAITGAAFIPKLDFLQFDVIQSIATRIGKLQKKEKLSRLQVWLGSYYRKEIIESYTPPVSIRWIDETIGWGVFAEKSFQKQDYIAEYAGILRKSKRSDRNNEYCFEYLYAPGIASPYTVDAQTQSGIARFINHSSEKMNLENTIVTVGGINHVVLFAKRAIDKGEQLTYDYGPDYWSKREKPLPL